MFNALYEVGNRKQNQQLVVDGEGWAWCSRGKEKVGNCHMGGWQSKETK